VGIWRSVPVVRPTAARPADLPANASAAMAAVLFGASVVAVRVAVRDVPPISLAVLRIGQGGLLLAVLLLIVAPDRLLVRWERLRLFALLGLVLFVLFPLTFNIGLRYTEASRGAVMLATMPIWSALLGRIAGERPGLLGALYGLIAKRVLAVDSAATVTTYAMLFGALALLPAALVEGLVPAVGNLDRQLLGLVVFLGVLGGSVAFLLWTWALSRLTPTQVCRLRQPEPDRGRPARDSPPGRTAQRPVPGRVRCRRHRCAAGQLAGPQDVSGPRCRRTAAGRVTARRPLVGNR
jgi:drug/metabolite transporter (DMT)-like permease